MIVGKDKTVPWVSKKLFGRFNADEGIGLEKP